MACSICLALALQTVGFGQVASQEIPDDVNEEVTINFPGGTIKEYVTLLRDLAFIDRRGNAQNLNVVVTRSASEFALPSIEVVTDLDGALGVIEGCSTRSADVLLEEDNSGSVTLIKVHRQEPTEVSVINVKRLISVVKRESLLSAIEIGLEMHDAGSDVTIKLHEETGLLFFKGPDSALTLIRSITQEMQQDLWNRNGPGMSGDSGGPDSGAGGLGPGEY